MKKVVLSLTLILLFASISYADLPTTSMRMRGMGVGIADIVADEYTDMIRNPAYAAYYNQNKIMVDPITAGDGAVGSKIFLLGRTSIMEVGANAAIDIGANTANIIVTDGNGFNIDADNDGNWDTGESELIITQTFDDGWVPDPTGGYVVGEIAGNTKADRDIKTTQTGKRQQEDTETNFILLGATSLGDIGLGISYLHEDYDSKTPNNGIRRVTEKDLVADDVVWDSKWERTANTDIGDKENTIRIGAILPFNEDMAIAGNLDIISAENITKIDNIQNILRDWNVGGTDSTIATPATTDDVNTDDYTINTITMDSLLSGTGIALQAEGKYQLTDKHCAKVLVGFANITISGDAILEDPIGDTGIAGIYGGSGLATVTDGEWLNAGAAGDKYTIEKNRTYLKGDVEVATNQIGLGGGIESQLSDKVLLGFGLRYISQTQETTVDADETQKRLYTYDINNDGDLIDAGDGKYEETRKRKYTINEEESTNIITIPIGVEITTSDWMKLRFGVSHTITTTKNTSSEEEDMDQQVSILTLGAGVPTTTYSPNAVTDTDGEEIVETLAHATIISSGFGFQLIEDLTIDVMAALNADMMNINNWNICATWGF